jgi:predicted DNA-binding transcriptional regulator AlpA
MSAPELEAVRALLADPDPKIAALARAVASLAAPVPSVRRLGVAELETRIGLDRSTIYRKYEAGGFPRPSYYGTRRTWDLAEVEAWEAEQRAAPHKPQVRGIAARKTGGRS